MTGKLSRLPHEIRLQINQRLADGQTGSAILPWLNSLPEVQAILADQFAGQPINDQNLSDYRRSQFRRWESQQDALAFIADGVDPSSSNQIQASPLVDQLVRWIATRFAAAAQNAPIPDDHQSDLREIRNYLADIIALRRGELAARRLALEQQRLALEQANSDAEKEREFWEWTKRPDIQAKLYPKRDPDKTRRDTIRLIDEHLLGVRSSAAFPDADPEPEPACLI